MAENCTDSPSKNKPGRKRGCVPWNKGIPRTDKEKMNMSLSRKGILTKGALDNLKKGRGWNKGKKMSMEFCNKISILTKGRTPWNKKVPTLCICGKKLSRHQYTKCQKCHHDELKILLKDRPLSESHKNNLRIPHPWSRGEKHRSWKGGITPLNQKIRKSRLYLEWRKMVFERDNWTCQNCGLRGGIIINAHHIKPFNSFPETRLDVSNGITLCKSCHVGVHSKLDNLLE